MNNDLICPICGESTNVYMGNARKDRLCKTHGKMANAGEIILGDKGLWLDAKTGKPLGAPAEETQEPATKNNGDLTCIVCGEPSNGKHFCLACYHKYKEKTITLKIHKCEIPASELLNESYEGIYVCNDGHVVKSMAEQTIDNWLSREGIFHGYEVPLDIGEDKPLKPDFYLKNYLGEGKDVYLEYFGLKGTPKYDKTTAYKMEHYKRLKKTLICMYPQDSSNLEFNLQRKLHKDKLIEGQIHYFEK